MKKHILFISVLILSWSFGVFAEDTGKIPDALNQVLKKRYPKYRLVTKEDYCANTDKDVVPYVTEIWFPGFRTDDFNGDGQTDYSVIIRTRGHYLWLGALANSDKNNPYLLKEFGEPFIPWEDSPQRKMKQKICGGVLSPCAAHSMTGDENPYACASFEDAGSGVQWYWKDGNWHQVSYEP